MIEIDVSRRRGEYASPLSSAVTAGRLVFERGSANDVIVADHDMSELFVARFDGAVPRVDVVGGTVRIRQSRARRNRGRIAINGRLPWALEFHGGAARLRAELADGLLSAITVSGGASHVDLDLPATARPVPIRFGGGVTHLDVMRPRDVPVRLSVRGGAARLAVDEQRFSAVGGPMELRSAGGDDDSTGRYDVEVGGGAHMLVIASR
jgi:hypothetical protein